MDVVAGLADMQRLRSTEVPIGKKSTAVNANIIAASAMSVRQQFERFVSPDNRGDSLTPRAIVAPDF